MSLSTVIEFIDEDRSPHDSDSKLSWELHDYLAEDISFEETHWRFIKEEVEPFTRKLLSLYETSSSGITFEATWSLVKVDAIRKITISELVGKILDGELCRTTKYIVKKD